MSEQTGRTVSKDENSKIQAPNFKQATMTKNPILKTRDRIVAGFRSFEFDILNLFGIWVL